MTKKISAKKSLGQHFLKDLGVARRIADALENKAQLPVLEIGPGMGVLTQFLKEKHPDFYAMELDQRAVKYLIATYPTLSNRILNQDFIGATLDELFTDEFVVIGNFPYNISSQIVFKVLENRQLVPEMAGMFQREVAQRICSEPGSKVYGILSVLTQAYYQADYLFTVSESVFSPPPKVKSGVIRLTRKRTRLDNCNEAAFKRIVKMAFNQRRKTLRNSLKSVLADIDTQDPIFGRRPESLSVEDFIYLTQLISPS